MRIEREIQIVRLKAGQERPFADRVDVWRVHFLHYRWDGVRRPDVSNAPAQPELALRLLGLDHMRRGRISSAEGLDEYAKGWIDHYRHVSAGVVEVRVVEPYID